MKTDLVAMKTDLESSGHALGLSVSEGEVGVEQLDVEIYGFADFAEPDIFVGGMGACGVAGPQFERREGHERLVAERGRAVGLFAHGEQLPDKGMAGVDAAGAQPCGAGLDIACDMRFYNVQYLLVGIEFVYPDVDGECASVGHLVVGGTGLDDGDAHLNGTQKG